MGCPHRSFSKSDMEDRLSRFLFANYDPYKSGIRPSISSIPGLADAVLEINGLFIESKVPLRCRVISLHASQTEASGINHVRVDTQNTTNDSFCKMTNINLGIR